jgi:hypothetical protein
LLKLRWSQRAGLGAFATIISLALALRVDPAAAEFQAALYGGFSESFDSDYQPGGTK